MKKLLYLSVILFAAAASAQSNNAILFTENGEKFQVILNGILQNAAPETNVKMTGLIADHYKCRILFADAKLGFVDFNMYFQEMGAEATWNIKQNNKGQYVTRWISSVPLAQAPSTPSSQTTVVYSETPAVSTGNNTTTYQQTQTTTTGSPDDVNINMGMNVDGQGGNISIHASGMNDEPVSGTSQTTTTTTHTVRTTSSGGTMSSTTPPPPRVIYVDGYNGPVGCPVPMNPGDFSSMKETIRSKDFENTKLSIAKQVLQNNCLTSSQVREVLSMFDFENTKLEYAKYAYDHTYDVSNYYKVNDAFEFESSTESLNQYISAKR